MAIIVKLAASSARGIVNAVRISIIQVSRQHLRLALAEAASSLPLPAEHWHAAPSVQRPTLPTIGLRSTYPVMPRAQPPSTHYVVWLPHSDEQHGPFTEWQGAFDCALRIWNIEARPVGVFKYREDWRGRAGMQSGYKQVTALVSFSQMPANWPSDAPCEEMVQTGAMVSCGPMSPAPAKPVWVFKGGD